MLSTHRAAVYLLFLTLSFPVVIILGVIPSLLISLIVKIVETQPGLRKCQGKRKTVLVTGAPHTKGLQMCRILSRAGHRVILADLRKYRWSAARFSSYVDKWVTLPDIVGGDIGWGYGGAIIDIVSSESVDWWVPVSHTVTAVPDTAVKKRLEITHPGVKVRTSYLK